MRTGVVRLEFHQGQLGCVVENENKSRHYRCRASRADGGLSPLKRGGGCRRFGSRSCLRGWYFAYRNLQRVSFRHRRPPFLLEIQSRGGFLDGDLAK